MDWGERAGTGRATTRVPWAVQSSTIKKHDLPISGIFFKLNFLLTRSIVGIVLLVGKEFLSIRKMFADVKSSLRMCYEDHEYGVLAPPGSYSSLCRVGHWQTELVRLASGFLPSPSLHADPHHATCSRHFLQ